MHHQRVTEISQYVKTGYWIEAVCKFFNYSTSARWILGNNWRAQLVIVTLRAPQTRYYCCRNIVSRNLSWARRRVRNNVSQGPFHWKQRFARSQFRKYSLRDHKTQSTSFPWCANGETFVKKTNYFWKKWETFFCKKCSFAPKQGNIFPQHCFRNNVSSFAGTLSQTSVSGKIFIKFSTLVIVADNLNIYYYIFGQKFSFAIKTFDRHRIWHGIQIPHGKIACNLCAVSQSEKGRTAITKIKKLMRITENAV